MKVLIIGSGGREHAIALKIKASPLVTKIYCAPGNGGIAEIAECIDIKVDDIEQLLYFAITEKIGLTIVGPEIPLVQGIVDVFNLRGLRIFGPSKLAAQLEGSKVFAKEFLEKFNIPTAKFQVFTEKNSAIAYVHQIGVPLVIKADGLAAGKGVIIANTIDEAIDAIEQIMVQKIFKEAGDKIIIEEMLKGEEVSFLAFTDGRAIIPMVSSQDHKRIFDNDQGPNTGGMGAYSPAPVFTKDLENKVINEILLPTIRGLITLGINYKGVIYVGLMITQDGPKVLEFNARFGDPETQVILPRLKTDIIDVMNAVIDEKLFRIRLNWDERVTVCVVLAAGGYPGKYENGKEIEGLDEARQMEDITVFHAGTSDIEGKIVTMGGRVLNIVGMGSSIKEAVVKTYMAVNKIKFDGIQYRHDIASKAMNHLNKGV
ncbi:MAG: phosphoribosylamine--glycine ligase [Candidatus Firestonebacteria bacterium]